jgi:urease accessory protein
MNDERTNETQFLQLLRMLQVADSALPIGATAHSFGLETLVAEGVLTVDRLEAYFGDYLQEAGVLEATFCRAAHQLFFPTTGEFPLSRWLELNQRLSALKPAREVRAGSSALGRRLLQLAIGLNDWPSIKIALSAAQDHDTDLHHCTAFGLVGAALGLTDQTTALAYLHQSLAGLISACQRLLPLGQSQAGRILWDLKPIMIESIKSAINDPDEVACFTPLLDLGSIRHPELAVRLFIS